MSAKFTLRKTSSLISFSKLGALFIGIVITSCWQQKDSKGLTPKTQKLPNAISKENPKAIQKNSLDTTKRLLDTLHKDSTVTRADTTKKKDKNKPNDVIKYFAEDSIKANAVKNTVDMYGRAKVTYQDFELVADYIHYDRNTNILMAKGRIDSLKGYVGKPIFKSGKESPMTSDSLTYNMKTKKGKSFGFVSNQEGGIIHAESFKKGSTNDGYFKNGIYTTCDAPHPHFGIKITRGIATENKIITGPAFMEIEDIPFPIIMPFGFFPKPNKRSSGIIIPSPGEDKSRGFYLRDFGYYLGINDYWDMRFLGSAYTKGSYAGSVLSQYRNRYKYSGNFNFTFANTQYGEANSTNFTQTKDFQLTWIHQQNSNANPGTTFGANVNIATSKYLKNTAANGSYDFSQISRNILTSSISYGKSWRGKPYNFTANLSHRQDMNTGTITVQLPSFSFNVSTFNPFDSKSRVGEQKWYQKITVGYSLQGQNSLNNVSGSHLFNESTIKKFQNGLSHNIPISLSFNAIKFFQVNLSTSYNERWYFQSMRKQMRNGNLVVDTLSEFSRVYDYSVSAGLSTKVYGMLQFRKGKIKAIRHVMTPNASLSWRPDFGTDYYGYYKTYADANGQTQKYSRFENGIYGTPGAGKNTSLSFGLDNTIEAKYKTINSSGEEELKKISILQGLQFNGSYNFLADSLKLSPISFNGRTNLFGEKFSVNFSGSLDPYQINSKGTRINKFTIDDGKIARLTNFTCSFGYSFSPGKGGTKSKTNNNKKLTQEEQDQLALIGRNPNAYVDFNIPWSFSFNYSFSYSNYGIGAPTTNNTLNFNGDISITPKWKITYNSGVDIKTKKMSPTSLGLYRDLHCWDLSFNWVPFGTYQSYNVTLIVKAPILKDLKMNKRRDFYNNGF